jgi:hypothetical protein
MPRPSSLPAPTTTAPTIAPIVEPTPSVLSVSIDPPSATPLFPSMQIDEANLTALRPLRTIGVGRAVQAALAPSGDTLAVATTAGVALFELPSMRQLRFDQIDGGASAVAFSHDGTLLTAELQPLTSTELRRVADGAKLTRLAGVSPKFKPRWSLSHNL